MQAYQIRVLFQSQRLFYNVPSLGNIDIGILLYCFLENVCIITETVSFGTQVADVYPLFRSRKHRGVTGIQRSNALNRFCFCPAHYLRSVFQTVGIKTESETGYPVCFFFTGYLLVCKALQRKHRNVFTLNISKVDLCCCISCICQNNPGAVYILENAIFHK